MNGILQINLKAIMPSQREVLGNQGMQAADQADDMVVRLFQQATEIFVGLAEPKAISTELAPTDFAEIYAGEGLNEKHSPLGEIFPKAGQLALFALTMGPRISAGIDELFRGTDFALGCMLDSYASAAADGCAALLEKRYGRWLESENRLQIDDVVVRYSPGYCGWHVSGQKKLFARLRPEKIGIRLRESCLMDPLKSISGVLVAGPRAIHIFNNIYPCCDKCIDQSCVARVEKLKMAQN